MGRAKARHSVSELIAARRSTEKAFSRGLAPRAWDCAGCTAIGLRLCSQNEGYNVPTRNMRPLPHGPGTAKQLRCRLVPRVLSSRELALDSALPFFIFHLEPCARTCRGSRAADSPCDVTCSSFVHFIYLCMWIIKIRYIHVQSTFQYTE